MRITGLILCICLLIAIFRYRIWESEVVIKKVLLYVLATSIIILSYLVLLYLVDLFTLEETKTIRFIILAVSVIIFLISRDWLQHLIERIFHCEIYDSATVVAEFEEKLEVVYRIEDLGSRILDGLNDIFHFNSLILSLRKERLVYNPAFILGLKPREIDGKIQINREFENKLIKSKVFSPGEIQEKNPLFEEIKGELIVPLVKDDQPFGFFVCGPKKSQKTYSMQDIRVLGLIAKRVIALFHTAELYQSDLDRQLMLEREWARIAQDMHDDIGAGLTKIAMMSEAGIGKQEAGSGIDERVSRIGTAAREMINRLNVIVWTLNPRYDNLESLISYARRYFGEYLENFDIGFRMEVSDEIPNMPVTPDFRRNAFYAWQEAVHNAVKHGKCSEVKLDLKFDHHKILVTISDNGKGFDRAKPGSGGNGLINMKKRAEELGGRFEIESAVGKGTKVSFEFSF
jgi:signal transduction histidine kinase